MLTKTQVGTQEAQGMRQLTYAEALREALRQAASVARAFGSRFE